jgi:hypothetical protein
LWRSAPREDQFVDALSDDDRAGLVAIWENRARTELEVASHFAFVTRALLAGRAVPAVVASAAAAVADETRHSAICLEVVERLSGRTPTPPVGIETQVPSLEGADPDLVPSLYLMALCCCNETIACVRLETGIETTRSPTARAALGAIYGDELKHARIGWAHLASSAVDESQRARLVPWVLPIVRASVEKDSVAIELFERFPNPDHGILDKAVRRQVTAGALNDVIIPGFAAVGIDAPDARAWAKSY